MQGFLAVSVLGLSIGWLLSCGNKEQQQGLLTSPSGETGPGSGTNTDTSTQNPDSTGDNGSDDFDPSPTQETENSGEIAKAWKDKTLRVIHDSFRQSAVGYQGLCFDFGEYDDAKIYRLESDGSATLLKEDADCVLRESTAQNLPGCDDGEFRFELTCSGSSVFECFSEPLKGTESEFQTSSDPPQTFRVSTASCE